MGNRPVYSSQTVQIKASDISRPPLGVGDSTNQASQANLRKLNISNTLYQLAYVDPKLVVSSISTIYISYNDSYCNTSR
jgi:hypothetical protein